MKQTTAANTGDATQAKQQKKLLIGLAVLTVAVLGGIALILWSVYGGQGTIKGMLTKYYEAMYTEDNGGFDALCDCLAPEIREDYYAERTTGGTDFSVLSAWRNEAVETVGENVKVKVEVQETETGSSSVLALAQDTCAAAEEVRAAVFHVTVEGSRGYVVLSGLAECVREGSDWYLDSTTVELKVIDRVVDGQQG